MIAVVDFRLAHAWLRGYSDALAQKDAQPLHNDPAAYERGRVAGVRQQQRA